MSSSIVTVLYPASAKFDLSYYLSTHMPLVMNKCKDFGMTGWKVTQLTGAPDGSTIPYSIQCELIFGNSGSENFLKALEANGKEVLGDIPNFCNENPQILMGNVVGSA